MSELRIAQMIEGQLADSDPFAQARNIYEQRQQSQPDEMFMMNEMFNSGQNNQQKMIAPEPNSQPVPPQSKSLIGSLNSAPKTDFASSGIPKILQKLGVDDKGLSMNQLGRIQLLSRLQNRFGADFQQNPDALEALSAFDEVLKKVPMDSRKETNAAISNGERTLKSLMGGS